MTKKFEKFIYGVMIIITSCVQIKYIASVHKNFAIIDTSVCAGVMGLMRLTVVFCGRSRRE